MRYLLLLLLFISHSISAQIHNPDVFGSLPYSDSVAFSSLSDVRNIGNFYFFTLAYAFNKGNIKTEHISIIKTDMDFDVVGKIDSVMINNSLQNFAYFIYSNYEAGYALLAGVQFKKNKNQFNILKLNLQTLEVHRTDSIQFQPDSFFTSFYFKHLNDTTLFTFGDIESLKYPFPHGNIFLKININGKIKQYKTVTPNYHTDIIGFEYLEKQGLYFVQEYSEDFLVFNKNLNLVQRVEDRFYSPGISQLGYADCLYMDAKNGYIHCIGRKTADAREYSVVHIRLPIIGDSIGEIDQVDPLLETNQLFNPALMVYSIDDKGNVLVALDDQFSFPGQLEIDTTTLYILKTNLQDYGYRENEWFIAYSNGTEMVAWGAEADKNGDFVIVGGYWSEEFYGERRNFYLKVQSDGTITTTKGPVPDNIMVVYPNPTYGSLLLKSDRNKIRSYEVYNTLGRLVKRAEINSRGKFEINDMSAGTYFLIFKDRKGKIIGKSRVVKY